MGIKISICSILNFVLTRLESSAAEQMGDYVHHGGNGILSVDPPKNNIFETADAIDYGKGAPDPFLVKGNSNQIPGNPFLLQDDQKQVLVAPGNITTCCVVRDGHLIELSRGETTLQ